MQLCNYCQLPKTNPSVNRELPIMSFVAQSSLSCDAHLEHPAQLEEPLVMAGITCAATNEYGPQSSHRNYAEDTVAREFRRREGIAIHFSDFTEAHEIDICSNEGRKREDLPLVTHAAQK